MTPKLTPGTRLEAGRRVFTRILVGIDGSEHALEAARQAALLHDESGHLTLLAAWDTAPTIVGGTGPEIPYYYDEELQRSTAERHLLAARDHVASFAPATGTLVRGAPVVELLREIERAQSTLVAVGAGSTGRLLGIVGGSTRTELVHHAPCSVLVARPTTGAFPRRIAVGVDGSIESAAAYASAHYLAERFDAELHAIVAWGGKGVDARLVSTITEDRHEDRTETPVHALTDAAATVDLVVVGSRGLHGLHALGSVSERVAHSASCSTLVVREAIWQRVDDELGR